MLALFAFFVIIGFVMFCVASLYYFTVNVDVLRGIHIARAPAGRSSFETGLESEARLRLKELPGHLILCVLLNEDDRFFAHRGFNIKEIWSRCYEFLLRQRPLRGGSSISEQTVKTTLFGEEFVTGVPYYRIVGKVKRAIATWKLERSFSKFEILELYLSSVQLTRWTLPGFKLGAQYYFQKEVKDLALDEAMFLASIIPHPAKVDSGLLTQGSPFFFRYDAVFNCYCDILRILLSQHRLYSLDDAETLSLDHVISLLRSYDRSWFLALSEEELIAVERHVAGRMGRFRRMVGELGKRMVGTRPEEGAPGV